MPFKISNNVYDDGNDERKTIGTAHSELRQSLSIHHFCHIGHFLWEIKKIVQVSC